MLFSFYRFKKITIKCIIALQTVQPQTNALYNKIHVVEIHEIWNN